MPGQSEGYFVIHPAHRRRLTSWAFALILTAAMLLAESVMAFLPAHAATTPVATARAENLTPPPAHADPVSDVPAPWTPQVLGGKIIDITQVGPWMVAGGNFSQVSPPDGGTVLNRSQVFAFSAINGAINTGFAPAVSGGVVNAVEAGPIPGTVYVGGNFQEVNGVTAKVVLLALATGQLVPGFTPPSMNGAVNDLQLVGDRLYVGGYFKRVASNDHLGLVALDAVTGARLPFLQVDLTENHNYTGRPGQARAGVGAKSIAVTPQGDAMAVVGNFRKANGAERRQIAMVDLAGSTAQLRADWASQDRKVVG